MELISKEEYTFLIKHFDSEEQITDLEYFKIEHIIQKVDEMENKLKHYKSIAEKIKLRTYRDMPTLT